MAASTRWTISVNSFLVDNYNNFAEQYSEVSVFCLFLQSWISDKTETDASLILSNVTPNDEGEYVCRANNFIGIAEASFWLSIYEPSAGKP